MMKKLFKYSMNPSNIKRRIRLILPIWSKCFDFQARFYFHANSRIMPSAGKDLGTIISCRND